MTALTGVNVIGYASGNLGLGVIAREMVRLLEHRGHPVAVRDLDPGGGRSGADLSFESRFVARTKDLPHPINLWVAAADSILGIGREICGSPVLRNRFNAVSIWWELPHILPEWQTAAEAFDVLVAGSEFIKESWANQVAGLPTVLARTSFGAGAGVVADRAGFGLPAHEFLVFTGFEPASDPVRKNPFAAIDAFQRAFGPESRAKLVIKLNNPGVDSRAKPMIERLEAMAAADKRLIVLKDRLNVDRLMALYASCDLVVSLHRSEGLGLMPLEAMHLGKPVVATGWSGNMTYMDHANSCPVRVSFVDTDNTSVYYSPRALGIRSFWAEPDVAHAASLIRWLANDPAAYKRLSDRSRLAAFEYDRKANEAGWVDEITALEERRNLMPAKDYAMVASRIDVALARKAWRKGMAEDGLWSVVRKKASHELARHVGWRFQRR